MRENFFCFYEYSDQDGLEFVLHNAILKQKFWFFDKGAKFHKVIMNLRKGFIAFLEKEGKTFYTASLDLRPSAITPEPHTLNYTKE